jgi:hypothetical protein
MTQTYIHGLSTHIKVIIPYELSFLAAINDTLQLCARLEDNAFLVRSCCNSQF